ncbi:hypothetical protein OESDEN_02625 [Oesophagostomum dentatum]|uniref:EndoU domain-containing protein n=1 Tax=Oesophagostomum dentatum TaxID=61180 RepID=A0A0B1TMQ9_OESDE|nr:hypothetical protein OESDEN_02625 [Oesophagostomum dentatum]
MKQLWFDHYSRAKGKLDTSGFEHVFIGEEKNGEVSGLHNWVRFYMLENNSAEKFDYKGFIIKRGVCGVLYTLIFLIIQSRLCDITKSIENTMASLKFTWGSALKKSGSLLIGTSPEYDMALYTMCFLSRRGKNELCEVEVDGTPISITSFDMIQNGKAYIGTIYPSAGRGKSRADRIEQTVLSTDENMI